MDRKVKNPKLRENVMRFAKQGLTAKQIASCVGVSAQSVRYQMDRLMEDGLLPPAVTRKQAVMTPEQFMSHLKSKDGVRFGVVSDVLRGLTKEQIAWLAVQIPTDGTMADVIRACVIDAYEEMTK